MSDHDAKTKADGAESASTAGLGAITLDGTRFVESKPQGKGAPNYACSGCAFLGRPQDCALAVDRLAKAAFGGDCDERDVIYVQAPNVLADRPERSEGPASNASDGRAAG